VPAIQQAIQQAGGKLGWLDRKVIYPVAIALMRERLLMLKDRFSFVNKETPWVRSGRHLQRSESLFKLSDERIATQELVAHRTFLRVATKSAQGAR